jgi:hypothetical protein
VAALGRWLTQHREWYESEFMKRVVPIMDAEISGVELIRRIASFAPAGERVHVLGIQNIKGTAFDFVLRWARLDQIDRALGNACIDAPGALETLAGLGELEDFEAEFVARRVRELAPPVEARERIKAAVAQLGVGTASANARGPARRALRILAGMAEAVADPAISVLRTRRARRIMSDLVHDRIETRRAAGMLRRLEDAQDGGWLM